MKNSNNKQDMKFNNQVNHMQGFIGMPQWNYRNPSLSESREYDRRILEKQALGFKPKRQSLLNRLNGWLMTTFAKAFNQIREAKIEAKRQVNKKANERIEPVKTGSECCS